MKPKLRWSLSTLMVVVAVAGVVTWIKAPEWAQSYRGWLANRAIHDQLARPMSLGHPDGVSLSDLMAEVRRKTTGTSFPGGLPIYVDPEGLQKNDIHMGLEVKINTQEVPLGRSLEHTLSRRGLVYWVENGLVTITSKRLAVVKP